MNGSLYYTPQDSQQAPGVNCAEPLPQTPVAVTWHGHQSGVNWAEDVVPLQEITDKLHVGLAIARVPSGEFLLMNEAGCELLGKKLKKGLTMEEFTDFFQIVQQDGSRYPTKEVWTSVMKTGRSLYLTDVFVQRLDGKRVPLRVSSSQIVSARGNTKLMVFVFEDWSQERRMSQAQAEFVAVASHQLRTPATGTKAFLSMLLDGDAGTLTEVQEDFVRRAYRSNERALRLAECLLQMAQIDAGQFTVTLEEADVGALLRDSVAEHEATMEKDRRQAIKVVIPQRTVTARMDSGKVRMLVDNLLDNAKKYSPAESSIEVHLAETSRNVILSVADNGSGIPMEQQGKLFRRFGRLNQETAADVPGTGLGLYFVQRIVGLHGGDVRIASVPGQGTLVIVKLPKGGERND